MIFCIYVFTYLFDMEISRGLINKEYIPTDLKEIRTVV